MVRKSQLERQLEALAEMLGALVGLKSKGDDAGMAAAMQDGFKSATGLELNAALALSEETLVSLFVGDPARPDIGRCAAAGYLLAEHAEHMDIGHLASARAVQRKALSLLVVALQEEAQMPSVAGELRERMTKLVLHLGPDAIPVSVHRQLFTLYERVGDFAHAENALFALRERGETDAPQTAKAFYTHLLSLPDAALEAGDLSRAEVEEEFARL